MRPLREGELRRILVVKAVEEADREGTLLPAADRASASREAKREAGPEPERMIAHRAVRLMDRVVARHPFVAQVTDLAGGAPAIGLAIIVAGFALGAALSVLDGTRRINVLAFPLLGLVAWNLAVYLFVVARALSRPGSGRAVSESLLGQAFLRPAAVLVARSRTFNAPLAEALARFLAEWQQAARPLLMARAARTFHLAAAAAGAGLVAGLYLRGVAFDYQAGWESTFLDAPRAHTLLATLYGPASWLTGIAIPDAAHLEAIRWRPGGGGESAGRWIHLLAATTVLYVIVPRLLFAAWAGAAAMRRLAAPASLDAYARVAFSGVGGLVDRGIVMVVPYAFEPQAQAQARLRTLIAAEMGEHLAVDARAPVAFGDEEAFVRGLADGAAALADVVVLLMNLSATPEDENHGAVIEGVRDWMARERPRSQLVVMVDEAAYATRMGAAGGAPARLDERRRAWQSFIAARGLEARIVDLSR